jgi:hypothetical protein
MSTDKRDGGQARRSGTTSPRTPAEAGSERRKSPNEGEGSRTAARDYNQRTERFIQSGRVEKSAEEAERAIEGREGNDLREAERAGRTPRRT